VIFANWQSWRFIDSEFERIYFTPRKASRRETFEVLLVSANGSVVQSFHGETPFTLNRARTLSKTLADVGRQ
jgi:hypothetical protein